MTTTQPVLEKKIPPQYIAEKYPRITIITPSFNQAAYLEATIQSVINQNYPNLEYIIMDGGSTDGSVDIIKKYEDKLAFWCSKPDAGMYDALQKGFEKSTGDIMAWLNSDDIYYPNCLFLVAEIFTQNAAIQWLTAMPTGLNESGNIVHLRNQEEAWSLYRFLQKGRYFTFVGQENTFWRRPLWQKSGEYISTDYALAGDFELWRRFFKYEKLYTVNTMFGGFRFRHSDQKSLEQRAIYAVEMDAIRAAYPLSKKQFLRLKCCSVYRKTILRVFRNGGIIRKTTKRLFDYPPTLFYNRFEDAFEWSKYF